MGRAIRAAVAALFCLASTSIFAASALALATPFTGILEVEIGSNAPIVIPVAGSASLNGSGGPGHLDSIGLSASAFGGGAFVLITDPAASPIAGLVAEVANAAGTWSMTPSSFFGGPLGLQGFGIVCLFTSSCTGSGNLFVPFTEAGTRGVGLGGSLTAMGGGIQVTLEGAPWTVGLATVQVGPPGGPFSTSLRVGFVHGPASGGLSSAGQPSGVVSLVTPVTIATNIGPSSQLPAFARVTLHFAPEPGGLLMLSAGAAGLVLLAGRRLR